MKRVLRAIGGNEAPQSDMTTKRLAEIDERDHQLEQRAAGSAHDSTSGLAAEAATIEQPAEVAAGPRTARLAWLARRTLSRPRRASR